MKRLLWAAQDAMDAILDRLSSERRWKIIDFLMRHDLINCCRSDAYFWSIDQGDSIFELSDCNFCDGAAYCYCGKERP